MNYALDKSVRDLVNMTSISNENADALREAADAISRAADISLEEVEFRLLCMIEQMSSEAVNWRLIMALKDIGPAAVPALIAMLKATTRHAGSDGGYFLCSTTISALGELGDHRAVDPIVAALLSAPRKVGPLNHVNIHIITEALRRLGAPAVHALIAEIYRAPHHSLYLDRRYRIAYALGELEPVMHFFRTTAYI